MEQIRLKENNESKKESQSNDKTSIRAVTEEMEEFYMVFNDGPFGYLIMDEKGYILRHNKIVLDIFGYPNNSLKRRRLFDFLYEDGKKSLADVMKLNPKNWLNPLRLIKTKYGGIKSRLITYYVKGFTSVLHKKVFCVLLLRNDFGPGEESSIQHEILCETIVNTQEAERSAISASLHDTVAQYLYGIHMHLQTYALQELLKNDLTPIRQMLHEAIHLIRDFSNDLDPNFLLENGLYNALLKLTKKLALPNFHISLHIDENIEKLTLDLKRCIYRIIQELINNAMKHAEATHIDLHIQINDQQRLDVIAVDNGKGFEIHENDGIRLGSGLWNIQNRVILYGGNLEVRKIPKGAYVLASLYINA